MLFKNFSLEPTTTYSDVSKVESTKTIHDASNNTDDIFNKHIGKGLSRTILDNGLFSYKIIKHFLRYGLI